LKKAKQKEAVAKALEEEKEEEESLNRALIESLNRALWALIAAADSAGAGGSGREKAKYFCFYLLRLYSYSGAIHR